MPIYIATYLLEIIF